MDTGQERKTETINIRCEPAYKQKILDFLQDDSIAKWMLKDDISSFFRQAADKFMEDMKNGRN